MGSGSWDTRSFVSYSTSKGYGTDSRGVVTGSYSNQEMFKAKNIDAALDPIGKYFKTTVDMSRHKGQ